MTTPNLDISDRLGDIAEKLGVVDLAINAVMTAHGDPRNLAGAGLAELAAELRAIAEEIGGGEEDGQEEVASAPVDSAFDREAVAGRAHDAVDLARSLVMALRGAEEGLEGVGSGTGGHGPNPSDRVAVDLMALGALAGVVANQMNEVAGDLHG